MSKEEAAGVEDLSQTTSPPLYFPYCLSSVGALSFISLFRDYFFVYLFSASFHSSHAQFLSSDQSFRKTWPFTAFLN